MSEYIVKLPTYGAADEFFKTHEMPDMTLYGYPLTGEIVRCRDCKHSDTLESAPSVVVRCCYKNRDKSGVPRVVGDDGFCAGGKVRVGSSRFE